MTEPPRHDRTTDDSHRKRRGTQGPTLVADTVDSSVVICDSRRPQAWIRADRTVSLDEHR